MELEELYKKMLYIRKTEEKLLELYSLGKLFGTVHTCIGQESISAGILSNINIEKDYVFSNHRCHGHYISLFNNSKEILAEIMGKSKGVCKGIGGSQHLHNKNFLSSGIQGGLMPISAGVAFTLKEGNDNNICVIFIGDGTFGQGIVYESLNMISLWKVPILIVVENNQYAQSTPIKMNLSGSIKKRLESFEIKTIEMDHTDVMEIYNKSRDVINEIRNTKIPQAIIINTYRLSPHSKGDDFRDSEEINERKNKDPLLIIKNEIGEKRAIEIEKEVDIEINNELKYAEDSEFFEKNEFKSKLKENGILRKED